MKDSLLFLYQKRILFALTAIMFNNWLLGLIVNRHVLFSARAVSDLSSSGQPYAQLFQILDIASGTLFTLSAFLCVQQRLLNTQSLIFIATLVLGLANILDAVFPITCFSNCTNGSGFALSHLHTYTSILIVVALIVSPLAGWSYAKKHNNPKIQLISLVTAIFSIFSVLFALLIFAINRSFSTQGYGPVQEVHLLIFGAWFVFFYNFLQSQDRLASNLQHR